MKILVPLDGSAFSEAALRPVIQVAEAVDAGVHLLTLVTSWEVPAMPGQWFESPVVGHGASSLVA